MSTFPGKRKRHKSEDSKNKSGQPLKKSRQRRETRQTYLDSDSTVSSLDFHPTTHTFAASCFDGKINLYHIDANKKTTLSHSLHHPLHKKTANTQSLKQLIESNEAKMQRLKELQLKNNQQFTFDFNEDDEEDEEDEDDCDDHKIDSISMESSSNSYKPHHAVPCKESLFNVDGSLIFGAWNDSEIGIFDHSKESLIHHFNNNALDTEPCKLSTIKMYNATTLISGDIDGTIRCWDIRLDLQKNNKSQRQYQYVSDIKHKLCQHEDGINCFESIPSKHRLIAGSGDGQISVWDLRKSSDLNAIKMQMQRKKKKALAKKRRQPQNQRKRENELLRMFGEEAEEIKPKTLIDISDRMGDEILSLCLMKYGSKLCSGMTSGFMNVFHYNVWDWYKDRVLGHSKHLSCIVKYDEDCCITGCGDGVVRLISLYPHKFIHAIGSHNLNAIDCIAMSADKGYVVSFACGDRRGMSQNRTNRPSLRSNHQFSVQSAEIVKVWNMNWHPVIVCNEKKKRMRDKFNRRRHSNQCKLAKGVKEFLELSDEDFSFARFDEEELERFKDDKRKDKKEKFKGKKVKDDYVFSDGDDDDENDDDEDIDLDEFDVDGGGRTEERRIRYTQFEDREFWMKSLRRRKKIRAVGQHDVNQYHNRRFFRDL